VAALVVFIRSRRTEGGPRRRAGVLAGQSFFAGQLLALSPIAVIYTGGFIASL
jgi:hypothetical protein